LPSLKDLLSLYRLDHAFLTVLAVVVGWVMASVPLSEAPWHALLPPFFITLGAFAHNDFVDMEVDRLNRRWDRPLARGRSFSALTYIIPYALGFLTAFFIPPEAALVALAFLLLSILYNLRLKRLPLVGNMAIAMSMAVPFIYAPLAAGREVGVVNAFAALFAFLIGTAREIVKDVEDVEGDRKAGMKTLPVVLGEKGAGRVAALFLLFLILLAPIPFRSPLPFYVLLLALLLIGWSAGVALFGLSRERAKLLKKVLYAASVVGLLALALLALGY